MGGERLIMTLFPRTATRVQMLGDKLPQEDQAEWGRFVRLTALRVMLRGRRMNFTRLAAAAGLGRSHVSQVLHGHPGRGGQSRRKLAKVMTEAEREVMGWEAAPLSYEI